MSGELNAELYEYGNENDTITRLLAARTARLPVVSDSPPKPDWLHRKIGGTMEESLPRLAAALKFLHSHNVHPMRLQVCEYGVSLHLRKDDYKKLFTEYQRLRSNGVTMFRCTIDGVEFTA